MAEGDHVLIAGMGAYTRSLSTGFNGYGLRERGDGRAVVRPRSR